MYIPDFRVKANGVPILSKPEIDRIAENFLIDFQPEALNKPSQVDIDGFLENYLKVTPDYQFLSHNGIYLGMTVFNDTNCVPIYDPTTKRAEYISAKANTVIFDNRLLESNQEHRYRFTAGHESGHLVFHTGFFSYDPDQLTLFDTPEPAMIKCRVDGKMTKCSDYRLATDHDFMEWQANYFSGAILMPKRAVYALASEIQGTERYRTWNLITAAAETFNVSPEAAKNRLSSLKLIEPISSHALTAFLQFSSHPIFV